VEQGAYRISHIVDVAAWDYSNRSPLKQPGVNVKEGDWLLAVNGRKLDVLEDPWAAFQGLADRSVILTVNDKPTMEGAREILVRPIGDESRMRHLAWVEANRRKVEKASGGKVG
jgi:tricorn protease